MRWERFDCNPNGTLNCNPINHNQGHLYGGRCPVSLVLWRLTPSAEACRVESGVSILYIGPTDNNCRIVGPGTQIVERKHSSCDSPAWTSRQEESFSRTQHSKGRTAHCLRGSFYQLIHHRCNHGWKVGGDIRWGGYRYPSFSSFTPSSSIIIAPPLQFQPFPFLLLLSSPH